MECGGKPPLSHSRDAALDATDQRACARPLANVMATLQTNGLLPAQARRKDPLPSPRSGALEILRSIASRIHTTPNPTPDRIRDDPEGRRAPTAAMIDTPFSITEPAASAAPRRNAASRSSIRKSPRPSGGARTAQHPLPMFLPRYPPRAPMDRATRHPRRCCVACSIAAWRNPTRALPLCRQAKSKLG
jgi:hypothetical protein